ncbi:glycosyl hydrolase family 28-related protein [Chryseobacterium proteolyticum]|uniref:glycosyl hydrolase family 28-related protein n=1 Tax=Chryseobacterium proteolyticum TaxID=118127 RepID=UPI0039832737
MKYFILLISIIFSSLFYAQSIIERDVSTGKQIEYSPVKTWVDGSLMTDEKVDDIIYIKKNAQYYLRDISEDKVNVKWFGAKGDNKADDSNAIQKAVNSGYALYFPPGIYRLNVTIYQHIKMEGNGINTILKPFDFNKAIFLYKTKRPFWSYSNVLSNMILESDAKKGFGVAFGNVDLNKKGVEDEYAGNVTFQNVNFKNFNKAVYFPFGNIGSNFYNCSFQNNKYGVYSLNNKFGGDIMHAGNKYFYGCEFSSNDVGAYVNNTAIGFGGISFNNVIFQMNQINAYIYSNNTYMPLQFLDCWDEKSATENEIEIDFFNEKEKKNKESCSF